MPEDKVTEALRFAAEPLSLSEPLREDGDAELGDVVEDRSAESPFEVAATALLPEEIARLLSPLDEREREILKLRFGLDRGEPRTLEEVGEHFNLTRERIRQIEARAMSKLRHPSSRHRRPRPAGRLIRPGSSRPGVSDIDDMADDPTADPDRAPGAPGAVGHARVGPTAPQRGRRRSTWSRRGCLTAAGVVGVLALVGVAVLVVVLVVAKGWLGDKVDDLAKERQEVVDETGIETGSTDVDHPPQRDIRLGACEFDAEGGVQASGTLTNWTESDQRLPHLAVVPRRRRRGPGHRVRLHRGHRRGRRGPRHHQLGGLGAGAARGLLHLPGGPDRPLGLRRGAPVRGRFLSPEAAEFACPTAETGPNGPEVGTPSCRQNLHAGAVERSERRPGRSRLVGDSGRQSSRSAPSRRPSRDTDYHEALYTPGGAGAGRGVRRRGPPPPPAAHRRVDDLRRRPGAARPRRRRLRPALGHRHRLDRAELGRPAVRPRLARDRGRRPAPQERPRGRGRTARRSSTPPASAWPRRCCCGTP